jgi:hypothetical protein
MPSAFFGRLNLPHGVKKNYDNDLRKMLLELWRRGAVTKKRRQQRMIYSVYEAKTEIVCTYTGKSDKSNLSKSFFRTIHMPRFANNIRLMVLLKLEGLRERQSN